MTPEWSGLAAEGLQRLQKSFARPPEGSAKAPESLFKRPYAEYWLEKGAEIVHAPVPHLKTTLMPSFYYPDNTNSRADWWQNKIDNIAVITALTPALAPAILADAQLAVYLYRTLPGLYDNFGKEVHGYIASYLGGADGTPAPTAPTLPAWPPLPAAGILAGLEARRAAWVQVFKKTTGYDPAVQGAALLLEATGAPFDPATYKADIASLHSPAPGLVLAHFRKARGQVDAMQFQGRKAGTPAWTDLGRFIGTPASLHIPIATPGQPEDWEIQGQAVKRDALIGLPSDIHSVTVRG